MMGHQNQLLSQEAQKADNIGATLRRFWRYFRKYWYGLLIVTALIGVSVFVQVQAPKIIGQAVDCYLFAPESISNFAAFGGTDAIFEDTCWYTDDDAATIEARIQADETIAEADKGAAITTAKIAGLTNMVLVLIGLYLVGATANGLAFFSMSWTGQQVLRQIRQDLFRQLNRLPQQFYTKNDAGNLMSRVTNDTDTLQQVFGFGLLNVASGAILVTSITYEMLSTNFAFGMVSLSIVPLMMAATWYFSSQARKAFRISRKEIGNVNADLQESIAGAREVQAFAREEESIEQFRTANAANRDANIRAAAFTSALNPMLEALGFVSLAIVVVAGGFSLLTQQPLMGFGGVITIGLAITYIQYVQTFNRPIQQIAVLWTNIQSAIAGGERIFSLLEEVVPIEDKAGAIALPPIKGNIVFNDVWAEYNPGEPVLKGINFQANSGEMIAIVGPTGAGKTTIINMIPRFYDVTQGSVTVDGHDVRDVQLASLRGQLGLVLQDNFLFSDTVMNNIRYGRLDATDEEVIAAAKMVAANEFIERLPAGYQTVLGERGSGLSQGQRQLIAIARVALMNPRVLILDEATSNVDTRTERVIQRAFETLLAGRTSFVIAHRLSTIRNADQVLMVRDGKIIERGTHTELLAQEGAYYELYQSQFRYEGDETPEN